jgi:AraC-like DNA-binding protein
MYQLRPPAPALQPYVEHYWFVAAPPGAPLDLRVDVFVDARADLVFTFGAPWSRRIRGGSPEWIDRACVDAQRLLPMVVEQRGDVRTCGVRFRLGGLGAFCRGPLAPWTGGTPAPRELLGPAAEDVERRLADDPDPDAGAAALDAWLTDLLDAGDGYTTFAAALAALDEGGASVDAAARAAGVSVRQVERAFARHLGIPPKSVARIQRFQRVLRALMRDPGVPLADVSAEAGYFDQAHMIRDFRRFSGGVPRGYRGYYPPAGPADFAPNVVVFVQDEGGGGS